MAKKMFWGAVTMVFLVFATMSLAVNAEKLGDTYYTKANIWYENPTKILSTNFHKGVMIPVGTKVNNVSIGKTEIKFTTDDKNLSCVLVFVPKHSTGNVKTFFDQYFSTNNVTAPDGDFDKFSKMEKENIKKGTIAEGMSKDAALMAYGYPPSHKTPSLDGDVWIYWEDRAEQISVTFKNNKVSNMQWSESSGAPFSFNYVQGTKISDEQIAKFIKGKTIRDEVVAALGGPQDIKFEGGKQILIYRYQKMKTFGANEGWDTIFIFNDKSILEDILKSRGSSSPNPLTGR